MVCSLDAKDDFGSILGVFGKVPFQELEGISVGWAIKHSLVFVSVRCEGGGSGGSELTPFQKLAPRSRAAFMSLAHSGYGKGEPCMMVRSDGLLNRLFFVLLLFCLVQNVWN